MNISKETIKLFTKLAKSSPYTIKRIRTLWLGNELDCIDYEDYYGSEKEKKLRKQAKKLSDIALIKYYISIYDADPEIFPKKILNKLTKKEKETLDIEEEF